MIKYVYTYKVHNLALARALQVCALKAILSNTVPLGDPYEKSYNNFCSFNHFCDSAS
jgi:hypothetical protein